LQDLSVIIVAGGSGTRMTSEVPKQFIPLGGKPLLIHSLETFHTVFPGIRIVVPLADLFIERWKELVSAYACTVPHQIVPGGETRFHSVKQGLQLIPDGGLTGIHDSARPLVTCGLIKRAYEAAGETGNAVPAIGIGESLRSVSREGNKPEVRDRFRIIQTPQVFRTSLLKRAYNQEYRETFTDDATVVEAAGVAIHLIAGESDNLKVTYPADLIFAEAILSHRLKESPASSPLP
jgi:2-C-methyl-D-erythritol 4-phosphate cytidylyltransferase